MPGRLKYLKLRKELGLPRRALRHSASIISLIPPYAAWHYAEVGVYEAENAARIALNCPNLKMALIDAYRHDATYGGVGGRRSACSLSQQTLDTMRLAAMRRMAPFEKRISWHRGDSATIGEQWVGEPFDMVFIDCDHRYPAVQRDIAAWSVMVKPGGLLCGHDYDGKCDQLGIWWVKKAVDEYSARSGLPVTTMGGRVWCIRVPEAS